MIWNCKICIFEFYYFSLANVRVLYMYGMQFKKVPQFKLAYGENQEDGKKR